MASMSKFRISAISDGLFIIFSSFLTAFTILFYLLKNNVRAILISLPLSVITFCVYMLIKNKKKGVLAVKKEDEERFLKCTGALCLASDMENLKRVFETLEKLGKKPFWTEDGILCNSDFFFVKFNYDPISVNGVVDAYKKTPKGKNLVFLGVNFSIEATAFVDGFGSRIKLVALSEFFPLLKKVQTLPEGGFLPSRKKTSFLNLLKATFSKGKAKTFATYGSFLLIMSRFVFFPVWYIISGSLFLIYAITIKFFAPKTIEKTFI